MMTRKMNGGGKMPDKQVIGLCKSDIDAIRRIEDLQAKGYDANQLYAITKDEDFHLRLQNNTKAEVTSAGPSIVEKVKSIFTKDQPIKEYLLEFGLSEGDAEAYYKDIDNELILLVMDQSKEARQETAADQERARPNSGQAGNAHSASPLPTREEAERRQRLQENSEITEPSVTDDAVIPPNQQPYHRDFF